MIPSRKLRKIFSFGCFGSRCFRHILRLMIFLVILGVLKSYSNSGEKGFSMPVSSRTLEEIKIVETPDIRDSSSTILPVDLGTENQESYQKPTGKVNVHVWTGACGCKLHSWREMMVFPDGVWMNTDLRAFRHELKSEWRIKDFVQRLFGYIHPPETGLYQFAISSDDNSELWLSTDTNTQNVKLIASIGFGQEKDPGRGCRRTKPGIYNSTDNVLQRSEHVHLEKGKKYYFDVYHKQMIDTNFLEVAWTGPLFKTFEIINESFISHFADDAKLSTDPSVEYESKLPGILPEHYQPFIPESEKPEYYKTKPFHLLQFVEERDFINLFPECKEYDPSYLLKGKLPFQYWAYGNLPRRRIYPAFSYGAQDSNIELSQVDFIKELFMSALSDKHGRKYTLKKVYNVVQANDEKNGDRFLLDLILEVEGESEPRRFSEHLYLPKNEKKLCYPSGMKWDKNAFINVVVTVFNQGRWVKYLIKNFQRLQKHTQDTRWKLIITDFASTDIDVAKELAKSSLKNYKLIRLNGTFEKPLAINSAARESHNDSLIFLCDLHWEVPMNIFDTVRKNSIKTKTIFSPMIYRLGCAEYPDNPGTGFWEFMGFGAVGAWKSDWDRIGGMNEKDFKYTWGGEDWELMDRVSEGRFEVERMYYPIFHFKHSKRKLWDGKNV